MSETDRQPLTRLIGALLCRAIVPAWVLTGAVFKLVEATPATLPKKTILNVADRLDWDLSYVLAILIGLEFFAAAVMVFLRNAARPMAIFMLSVFCMILIGEIALGNSESCGCLGTFSPSPWVMLAIDGTLLLATVLLPMTRREHRRPAALALGCAAVITVAGFTASFGRIMQPVPTVPGDGGPTAVSTDPRINPNPKPLERNWYESDFDSWIGKSWKEIGPFPYMPKWPSNMNAPVKYVVFYSRTCDHCEGMFNDDLAKKPELAAKVTAIEIPESRTELTAAQAWPMPRTECELMALPLGSNWVITAPLALRIENGIVQCATEGDHKQCLQLD